MRMLWYRYCAAQNSTEKWRSKLPHGIWKRGNGGRGGYKLRGNLLAGEGLARSDQIIHGVNYSMVLHEKIAVLTGKLG